MLIRTLDLKYPCTWEDVGRDNPNVYVPKNINDLELATLGFQRVGLTEPPTVDSDKQTVTEALPALIDGVYTQQWLVTNLSGTELEDIKQTKRAQAILIIKNSTTSHLDSVANAKDYKSVSNCIGYMYSKVPLWAAEAKAMSDYQDAVWEYYYTVEDAYKNGDVLPSLGSYLSGMPVMTWPV